ncbi:hypothetical protein N7466_005306 [Penicillium verhagenii]|uniref:uncharacterized protein n=1 Tax=Penicillium verhagenii TaxID=1562060 RepID=UPI0025450C7B|nr:uncharacterized protein N7466_005306 [Penicillium verhagenii]KAJ5935759.1 hypothetical protein N7466_005306 [Penicillium verhagenii]
MPTAKYFDHCPPFPSGVHVVPLPKISFKGLQNGNEKEIQTLFQACQEWGFFMLDLQQSEKGKELLGDAEKMFELTQETYSLDQSVLDSHAYKPPYDLTGYADIREEEKLSHKLILADVIFLHLDNQLGLRPGTLKGLGPLDQISETSVRLLRSQSQSSSQPETISLGGHTDIGVITLLFNVVGGLQILPADCDNKPENWLCVKPEPGNVLVNIGDTLVEWTGGILRSSLHRVITAPGEQALVSRQSVAYLMRSRSNASMQRLKSDIIPPVAQDEEEETRSVTEWAAWRAMQVMLGQLKPQTRGGKKSVVVV